MARLIVRPIDPDEPGSYRERSKLFAAIGKLNHAQKNLKDPNSGFMVAEAFQDLEGLIVPRLRTDDEETTVEAILDRLSSNEFDSLLKAIMGEGQSVPPTSATS